MAWNIFRILGDCSHLSAKCILIFAIHRNRSAEGVSMITQILYTLVFCTRYLDLFGENYLWNRLFKIFYILTSFYTVGVMQWLFPRSREREVAWKLSAAIFGGSVVLAPFTMMIFEPHWRFTELFWVFSQILESVCVLPQLLLLRQTTVPTVINSFYLVTLGSYRALYCLNWIIRELDINDRHVDPISVIFGIIQTALYVDFAWVYYTRQRVKLRGGGIVDADDLRRGYLVHRIFGRASNRMDDDDDDDDEERGNGTFDANGGEAGGRGSRPKWGSRGISVSADEGMFDAEAAEEDAVDPDAKMHDPDDLAKALDDDDDEEAGQSSGASHDATPSGLRSGEEWRD